MAAPTGDATSSPFAIFFPFVVMAAVFYFILFRPMRQRQKKLQGMIDNLKRGDKVITTGGIFGVVVGIGDRIIQLRIADQVTIEVSRNAVAALQQPKDGGEGA